MPIHQIATGEPRWTSIVRGIVLVCCLTVPTQAENDDVAEPVTARITLGSHEGAAHPTRHGAAMTGGGNINISRPAPDTLLVTMSGQVAAAANALTTAEAALDFYEQIQFQVEFSKPGHAGQLIIKASVKGLLNGQGRNAVVGMEGATTSVFCGPQELATLTLPPRSAGGCDSLAVNAAHGPVCIPASGGCYRLHQQFRITAFQGKTVLCCGKASAEFAPADLPSNWMSQSHPFKNVDKSDLGYQVIVQAVPSTPTVMMNATPITPFSANHQWKGGLAFPAPPVDLAELRGPR